MARRLAVTVLLIGLSGSGLVVRAQTTPGPTQTTPKTAPPTTTAVSTDLSTGSEPKSQSNKPPAESRSRPERHDGERRDGEKHEGDRRDPRFGARLLMEAVRRDGGPLELAPILLSKNAVRELELDESIKTDVESFFQGLQKKWEEERKAAEGTPPPTRPVSISERVSSVSESFNELFQKLPQDQRDRVLGAFVQWRKYRSLSNRMIAIEKLGMTSQQASELRHSIDTIRDEVLNESRDKFRQLWESGRDRSEAELLMHKNREKMDERIKAKLTAEQIEKLDKLRGKPLSEETLRSLDAPPPPPPRR